MIAQAGATFNVRGTHPFHNPGKPSTLKICHKNLGIERSSGANALIEPLVVVDLSLNTCWRVFPTSKGVVRTDATAPDKAPAAKLSVNVAAWSSLLCDLLRARLRGPSLLKLRPRDF